MLPHDATERKKVPLFRFLTTYFPDAIEELTKLCVQGNIQHNPERAPEDIVWTRGKSTDQLDAGFRHMWDHATVGRMDVDGQRHLIKAAWRMLAEAQLNIEEERRNEG